MSGTGIFYHDICRDRDIDWLLAGRLVHFPGILEKAGILDLPGVELFTSEPTPVELLPLVHSESLIREVERDYYYQTALYSTGGTVMAGRKIMNGELKNAFVLTGSADHHAGRNSCWGGCHFNGAALSIRDLESGSAPGRYAILDTDHHHGDGTRNIFARDENVLHICFCSSDGMEGNGTKYDFGISYRCTDAEYLSRVRDNVPRLVAEFKPQLIYWEYGYDNTRGDYGDIGVSADLHIEIAKLFKQVADEHASGRLVVILCGGSSPDTADYTIPAIIKILANAP
jgi:acetoin utilization deacetylase AcuC-like enzyme